MPTPTKPAVTPKELLVAARRAEAAATAIEQDIESARARGATAPEIAAIETRAAAARKAAAARQAEQDQGLADWDAYHASEEADRAQAEAARIADIQRRAWPEGRP